MRKTVKPIIQKNELLFGIWVILSISTILKYQNRHSTSNFPLFMLPRHLWENVLYVLKNKFHWFQWLLDLYRDICKYIFQQITFQITISFISQANYSLRIIYFCELFQNDKNVFGVFRNSCWRVAWVVSI